MPDTPIAMRWAGAGYDALTSTIGVAARLCVNGTSFVAWRDRCRASPVHQTDQGMPYIGGVQRRACQHGSARLMIPAEILAQAPELAAFANVAEVSGSDITILVSSSFIESIGFKLWTGPITVNMTSGSYEYAATIVDYVRFLLADSKGQYFNEHFADHAGMRSAFRRRVR